MAIDRPHVNYPQYGRFFTEWWITCAGCGGEHPCAARSRQTAERNALRDGWAKLGTWFCPRCLASWCRSKATA